MRKAFTLIEAIIVISILLLLAGLSSLSLVNFGKGSTLQSGQGLVLGVLRQAQSRSAADIGDKPWGVHFESARAVLFQDSGSGYNSSDPNNQVKIMPTGVGITYNFGGPSDILFEKGLVTTLNGGTITLTATTGNTTSQITVNTEGRIDY